MACIAEKELKQKGLEILLAQPVIAVSLFFMWLCGIAVTYLVIGTNTRFSKQRRNTESFWFRLAMGFLPCAIVILVHHFIVFNKLVTSVEDLAASSLPSALILASLTFIGLIVKAFK